MKLQKNTEIAAGHDRWYDDACGTAMALELVGERWALLIVRELMFGARRFNDLRQDLPGISAKILTQRLGGLERAAILRRRRLPPPASVQVYELTPWGYQADVAIQELGRWAARSPDHDPTLPLSAASLMMSFRTMIDRTRCAGLDADIGFVFDRVTFRARVDDRGIAIARADAGDAALVFATDPMTLGAIVYGKRPVAAAEAAGALALTGDRALADQFIALFTLPPKAG